MRIRDVDGMKCAYCDHGSGVVTCIATDGYVGSIGYYQMPPEVGAVGGKFGDRLKRMFGRGGSSREAAKGYVRAALGAVAASGVLGLGTSAALLATARALPAGDAD